SSVQDHQEEARLRRRRRRRHSAQCYQPSDCKNSLFEESVEREDGSGKEEVRVQTWENSEGVLKAASSFSLFVSQIGTKFQAWPLKIHGSFVKGARAAARNGQLAGG
ncbi:Protein of unknown function, partial [Gryllus bimaculatus]